MTAAARVCVSYIIIPVSATVNEGWYQYIRNMAICLGVLENVLAVLAGLRQFLIPSYVVLLIPSSNDLLTRSLAFVLCMFDQRTLHERYNTLEREASANEN